MKKKKEITQKQIDEIEKVYDENVDKIFRYILSRVGQKELAEDLTSETFHKVVNKYEMFDSKKASISTWVFTIARNTMYDYFRSLESKTQKDNLDGEQSNIELLPTTSVRLQKSPDFDAKTTNFGNKMLDNIVKQDRNKEVLSIVIDKLKDTEQQILFLRFTQQMSYKEIAKELGISVDDVGVKLHRVIKRMRKKLEEENLVKRLDI